jgi:hypothetical protein
LLAFVFLTVGVDPITVVLLIAAITITGAQIAVLVIVSRGAQTDLLSTGQGDISHRLGSEFIRFEAALGHVYGFFVCCIISFAMAGNPFSWLSIASAENLREMGIAVTICEALSMVSFWFGGIVSIHFFAFCLRQVRLFNDVARTVEINLLRIDTYQFFSLQFMRYLLLFATFSSLVILVIEFVATAEQAERLVTTVLAPLAIGATLFSYFFAAPIVLIRNRIRDARLRELVAVRAAIAGARDRLADTSIRNIAGDFSAPDLMLYEQKLEAMWDWPIQNNVQRLILYVALPPIAWIMAALVERMVDSLL